MNEVNKFIGKKIKEAREELGKTQKDLGELLGYSPMGISHFENGIRELKVSDVEKLAGYFKKDLNFFMPSNFIQSNLVQQDTTFFRADSKSDPSAQESLAEFNKYLETIL